MDNYNHINSSTDGG